MCKFNKSTLNTLQTSDKLFMQPKLGLSLIIVFFVFSCNETYQITKIEGKRIEINKSIPSDSMIEAFVSPYRNHVNKELDSVICYAPHAYSKNDGELNTPIGNFMADAVFEQCNPIFFKRTGQNIDFVLLNYGGIRANISKGPITSRTAYQIMPFENTVIVAKLSGEQVRNLLVYLTQSKRAHPISKQLHISLNNDYSLKLATLNNKPFNLNELYYVATNDYLYNGGGNMTFFKNSEAFYDLNYKVRNVLIDYFVKNDTLQAKVDQRFIRETQNNE